MAVLLYDFPHEPFSGASIDLESIFSYGGGRRCYNLGYNFFSQRRTCMSNVPMTRPEEALAIHDTRYFHSSTFTELDDGLVLHAAGTTFTMSDDGGIRWSGEFQWRDENSGMGPGAPSYYVKVCTNRSTDEIIFW